MLFKAVIHAGDRVCLEGDNQKQADFLARALVAAKGIAKRLDFSYSGPQSEAVAKALNQGHIELGAIHTDIKLFACYFMDLTP